MKKLTVSVVVLALAGCGESGGAAPQEVTIEFAAKVGTQDFVCGQTYDNLGANDTSLQLSDFRFYVQSVELEDGDGNYVAVTLDTNNWQSEGTALLDFEDGCGGLGDEGMNALVRGTAPAGDYDGIRFEMGVPFEQNHRNPATSPPPLNLTSMQWNWQGGYKFLRIDSGSFSMSDWRMHLGSTACDGDPVAGGTTACGAPNRVVVVLDTFDPDADTVVADYAMLVEGAELDVNQMETPVGCMSGPMDGDCAPLFDNLGLPFGGSTPTAQRFFSVE
jgi:uncharacterized repeat protein (TIGR04052 family)